MEDSLMKCLYQKWLRLQKFLDIRGGAILGLFSLEMLAIIAYYACKGQNLPTTVRDVYVAVLSAFAVHATAKIMKGGKEDEPKD
jgi:hypothetical protein